jgi:F-type H+-transporting ATPase subunit a
MIMSHVIDGSHLEVPAFNAHWAHEVHLPHLHLGGLDISPTRHVLFMWLAMVILVGAFVAVRRRMTTRPEGRLYNLLETFVAFVRDEIAAPNIGEHDAARWTPYLCTLFFFILTCNVLGMLPYGASATGNISVTVALALTAFLSIQLAGIRAHGLLGHFKNLVPHGVPLALLPIMIPIELVGMFAKPFALAVRLFANMTAGHIVLLSFIALVFVFKAVWVGAVMTVPFSAFINLLECLIVFLQAYIFTMLTALFIGMSVHSH